MDKYNTIQFANSGLSADCNFSANVTIFILPPVQNTDVVVFQVPPNTNRLVTITIPNNIPVNTVLFPQLLAFHIASQKRITNFTLSATSPDTIGYINVNKTTGL